MIKKVIIKNFRNIKNLEIDLSNPTTIIGGKNELGKSNSLNAVMWLFTGTILTDNWGQGENDIESIIPIDQVRGINPEVSIICNDDTSFTKVFVSEWSKDGTSVTKHSTKFYVNGAVCKNATEFTETLNRKFQFTPSVKSKEINEMRLFVDPLYALQKLDAKQLRALLVDLGCSVTDEELYAMGFEELRPLGEKYMSKWTQCRIDLKNKNKVLASDVEHAQAQIETVVDYKDFDNTELNNLTKEQEALMIKKANYKANNLNTEVVEIEKEIAVLDNTIKSKNEHQEILNKEKAKGLELEKKMFTDTKQADLDKLIKPKQEELSKIKQDITLLNFSIEAYDKTIKEKQDAINLVKSIAKDNQDKKTKLGLELVDVKNSTFKNMVICPVCGSEFPSNDEELIHFEKHRQEQITNLTNSITDLETKNQEYKAKYEEYKLAIDEALKQSEKANNEAADLKSKANKLEEEIETINNQNNDTNKVEDLDKAILEALSVKADTSKEENQKADLKAKLEALQNDSDNAINEAINNIDEALTEINLKIAEEHAKQSKYNDYLDYSQKLETAQQELMKNEKTLSKVNALIQKMISLINEKATEKTGLTFVMLEENLTNDGLKEVCYATIEGVPFKDVNTANKLRHGIKFIETLKHLLGDNKFPILADRMEGIDSIETIRTLTNEQLICTRVSQDNQITIY